MLAAGALMAHKRGYESDRQRRIKSECETANTVFDSIPPMLLTEAHYKARVQACSRGGYVLSDREALVSLVEHIKIL
jgi:hypothetical protein